MEVVDDLFSNWAGFNRTLTCAGGHAHHFPDIFSGVFRVLNIHWH